MTLIHIPDGQDTDFVRAYFASINDHAAAVGVPLNFDMVGLSYYPARPWDVKAGYPAWRLSHLIDSMNYIATTLHKPVMIVETDWPHAGTPKDMPGTPEFAFTPEGQAQYYKALIEAIQAVPNGMGRGVLPWEVDNRKWDSVFDSDGNALPAVAVIGGLSGKSTP
jgi:arabinogalactan endo-1,4-beta-galactosidase